MEATHYAFSDDSKHRDGIYNSLALITLKREDYNCLNKKLKDILKKSGISKEFKWVKLNGVKYRYAAEKLVNFVFNYLNFIRIDVLTWNLKDSRHKNIPNRNDSENLVRMYYHLMSTTLSMRWPIPNSVWNWYPDRQSAVNWKTLKDCINNKKHPCIADLFQQNPNFEQVKLERIEPSESSEHPFIQLSDLFAGIAAYSFGNFDKYKKWEQQKNCQLSLFFKEKIKFTNSEKERFQIIELFNKKCKDCKLQIAFNGTSGFKSNVPKNINFWLYEPQHKHDKAPQKQYLDG